LKAKSFSLIALESRFNHLRLETSFKALSDEEETLSYTERSIQNLSDSMSYAELKKGLQDQEMGIQHSIASDNETSKPLSPPALGGKPCKACPKGLEDYMSFRMNAAPPAKHMSSSATKPPPAEAEVGAGATDEYKACPPDASEIGRSGWITLHSMAAYYPDKADVLTERHMKNFLNAFAVLHPCQFCGEHMMEYIKQHPPTASGQHAISQWMCQFHNAVNAMTGKPQFDCSQVNQRWRDGWDDDRC
jgi:FAD-linked sulfhydryl oxidase